MDKLNEILKSVRFGADPELLLALASDASTSVPAWEYTKGTKSKHEDIAPNVNIHADGVALEFNITPVDGAHFHSAVNTAMSKIKKWAVKNELLISQVAEGKGFSTASLLHPLALESGCDPDFCAYDEEVGTPRIVSLNLAECPFRYFGGHIHIGYPKQAVPPWALIRAIDALWYLHAIQLDKQESRRRFYGKAGTYRVKPYGVEYRTPSSFWLDEQLVTHEFVNNIMNFIGKVSTEPKKTNEWFLDQPWKEIQQAIDDEKIAECTKLHNEVVDSWERRLSIDFWRGF